MFVVWARGKGWSRAQFWEQKGSHQRGVVSWLLVLRLRCSYTVCSCVI